MLTVPSDLDESALAPALRGGWRIDAGSMSCLSGGWGGHHRNVHDGDAMRWFVAVDELENKRVSGDESVADGRGPYAPAAGPGANHRAAGDLSLGTWLCCGLGLRK